MRRRCDRALSQRDIQGRLRLGGKTVTAHVADHANDRDPVLQPDEAQPFADDGLVRPEDARRHLIDERDGWRAVPIGVGERSPGEQRDSHDPRIIGRDRRELWRWPQLAATRRVFLEVDRGAITRFAKWNRRRYRRGAYGTQRLHAFKDGVVECAPATKGITREARQRYLDREDSIGAEARIDLSEYPQALEEQPSAGNEEHGKRDLGNDERLRQAASWRPRARRTAR